MVTYVRAIFPRRQEPVGLLVLWGVADYFFVFALTVVVVRLSFVQTGKNLHV